MGMQQRWALRVSGLDEPGLVGADHDLDAVAQAGLAQDARDVALDGRVGATSFAAISAFESPRATSLVTVSSRSLSSSSSAGGRSTAAGA